MFLYQNDICAPIMYDTCTDTYAHTHAHPYRTHTTKLLSVNEVLWFQSWIWWVKVPWSLYQTITIQERLLRTVPWFRLVEFRFKLPIQTKLNAKSFLLVSWTMQHLNLFFCAGTVAYEFREDAPLFPCCSVFSNMLLHGLVLRWRLAKLHGIYGSSGKFGVGFAGKA